MIGIAQVQEPYEGCFDRQPRLRSAAVEARRALIDTPRRRWIPAFGLVFGKRVGGAWVKAYARCSLADPGRVKPKGATGGWRAKPRLVVRDFWKG
jgi:hypothetical protein